MAIRQWITDAIALAQTTGWDAYFSEPLQIGDEVAPPIVIVTPPSDTYDEDRVTLTREFTLQLWVERSNILDAYDRADALVADIQASPPTRRVDGDVVSVTAVEAPELPEAPEETFMLAVTLAQIRSVD